MKQLEWNLWEWWQRKRGIAADLSHLSDSELLALYTDVHCIDVGPRIRAGRLLHARGYDKTTLIRTRNALVANLQRQYAGRSRRKLAAMLRETITTEVFVGAMRGVLGFYILRHAVRMSDFLVDFAYYQYLPYLALILCITPFINLKRTHARAVRRAYASRERIKARIEQVGRELDFENWSMSRLEV